MPRNRKQAQSAGFPRDSGFAKGLFVTFRNEECGRENQTSVSARNGFPVSGKGLGLGLVIEFSQLFPGRCCRLPCVSNDLQMPRCGLREQMGPGIAASGRLLYSAGPLALQVTQVAGRGRSAPHIPSPSTMASGTSQTRQTHAFRRCFPPAFPTKASTPPCFPSLSDSCSISERALPQVEKGACIGEAKTQGQCLRLTSTEDTHRQSRPGRGGGHNNAPGDVHVIVSDPVHR